MPRTTSKPQQSFLHKGIAIEQLTCLGVRNSHWLLLISGCYCWLMQQQIPLSKFLHQTESINNISNKYVSTLRLLSSDQTARVSKHTINCYENMPEHMKSEVRVVLDNVIQVIQIFCLCSSWESPSYGSDKIMQPSTHQCTIPLCTMEWWSPCPLGWVRRHWVLYSQLLKTHPT